MGWYGLVCKYGTIFQMSVKNWTQNWILLYFIILYVSLFFELKDAFSNLCLFALSWLEIEHTKKALLRRELIFFSYKMYKEKLIKRKIMNLIEYYGNKVLMIIQFTLGVFVYRRRL